MKICPSPKPLYAVRRHFSSEAVAGPQVPASAEPPRPSRRKAWQLSEEVEGILDTLPEVFDRNHVSQALGYEPDRGSLYKYRKTGTSTSPDVM